MICRIYFRVKGEVIHSRIPTKEETGQLKYCANKKSFDSLHEFIEFVKIGTHTCILDGSNKPFTLTTPIPKDTNNDK